MISYLVTRIKNAANTIADWSNITNKPTSFTPSAHSHTINEVGVSNDYTDTEKTKLSNIEENANNYTHPINHAISEVVNLQSSLDDKIESNSYLANINQNLSTESSVSFSSISQQYSTFILGTINANPVRLYNSSGKFYVLDSNSNPTYMCCKDITVIGNDISNFMGSSDLAKWMPIVDVTITSTCRGHSTIMIRSGGNYEDKGSYQADIEISCYQTSDLTTNLIINLKAKNLNNLTKDNFKIVVTTDDTSSKVFTLYFQSTLKYLGGAYRALFTKGNNITWDWLSLQTIEDALPTGTQVDCEHLDGLVDNLSIDNIAENSVHPINYKPLYIDTDTKEVYKYTGA